MTTHSISRFMLIRGPREPMIWPFRSAEDAEEWALEHGCIDYRVQEMAEEREHEAVCARCREPWPCEHERIDRETQAFAHRLARACSHCGQEVRGGQGMTMFGGLLFHTAKSRYPDCAKAAMYAKAEWHAAGSPGRLRPLPEGA